MKNLRLQILFKKYINKECTPVEYDELMLMINDQRNNEQLEEMIAAAGNDLPDVKLGNKQAERIYRTIINSDDINTAKNKSNKLPGLLGIAASILLLLSWALFFNKKAGQPDKKTILVSTKTTNDHQLIKLSDGSTVILNKNSHISYPAVFAGATREVTLVGEGYFDIRHNAHQPFLVHAGKLTVTVLGTAFNVKSTPSGNNVAVTVTRGKVAISENKKLIGMLVPNHQILVREDSAQPKLQEIDAARVIKWQAEDIYFDNVTMDSAMTVLSDHFNAKIKFDGERVKYCTLTGTFTHNESLQQIIKVLCSFNNAKYEIKPDRQIVISGPGCK
jgi:ferric-dicitrate binding protein FerR (iron transport regulator)